MLDLLPLGKRSAILLWSSCIIFVFLLGCGGEEDYEHKAIPRDSIDHVTAEALIQSQQALRQGDLKKAMALVDTVVGSVPRLADAHFQRGRVLSEIRQYEEAKEAYHRVIQLEPEYRGAWLNLGNNAYRQREYTVALENYEQEAATYPSADVFVYMGEAYEALGQIEEAERSYHKAIEMKQSHHYAHALLGLLYEAEGDLEKAVTHSRQAVEISPDRPKYRYALGAQLLQMDNPQESATHLKDVIGELPWHQGAHYNLGRALQRLDRDEEAHTYLTTADSLREVESTIENLESTARNSLDDPRPWVELGDQLEQIGRLEEAEEAFSVALYMVPDHMESRNRLALIHSQQGNYEAALNHFGTLLQQYPGYANGWFNLGVLYARLGARDEAERAWRQALQQEPNHEPASEYLERMAEDGESRR